LDQECQPSLKRIFEELRGLPPESYPTPDMRELVLFARGEIDALEGEDEFGWLLSKAQERAASTGRSPFPDWPEAEVFLYLGDDVFPELFRRMMARSESGERIVSEEPGDFHEPQPEVIVHGYLGLTLDKQARQVWREGRRKRRLVENSHARVLERLMIRKGAGCSVEDLRHEVWERYNPTKRVNPKTVHVAVSKLKRVLQGLGVSIEFSGALGGYQLVKTSTT
jgi:hypothetical protein